MPGPGKDYRLFSGSVVVNGTSAAIAVTLLDDLVPKATRTLLFSLNPDAATPPRYQLGAQSVYYLVIEDNDAYWEGQISLGAVNFSLRMLIAQQGTNFQAALIGASGNIPAGTWPVSLQASPSLFSAVIGPIQAATNASFLGASPARYFYLTASAGTNGAPVYDAISPIVGTASEEWVFSDGSMQYLNRTGARALAGTFTLHRVDANAPQFSPVLTPVGP